MAGSRVVTRRIDTADAASIIVDWREDLANLIPHARRMQWNSQDLLVFPNEHAEARVCRNVGVAVPAPILTRYDWMGQSKRVKYSGVVQALAIAYGVTSLNACAVVPLQV